MNNLVELAQGISAAGFLGYGISCLTTQKMRVEFLRYGLPGLRRLTGCLQIAAGCGLILGYAYPLCALAASLGLTLMMLVALGVRLRIRDPLGGFLQAFACFLLNLFVFQGYLTRLMDRG
ncbi:MAG: hypothetical protein EBS01_06420 [Verrucomicrobia bacterium]|nr:hypothetical protein [Verrucomicrobiota bacterium]